MKNLILIICLFVISGLAKADNFTYFKGPQLVESNQVIISSGGTTQLTATSTIKTVISGTNAHTVKLPDTTGLSIGVSYQIINKSTQSVTVKDFSDVTLDTITTTTDKTYTLFSGGTWYSSSGGGGNSGKALVGSSPIVITQDASTATISFGTADYIDLNTAANPPHQDGRLHWDSINKTLSFDVDVANGVEGQVNEEMWVEATNNTGTPILDGQVVYINGAASGFPTIALASSLTFDSTLGVATQNIANGANGKITTKGTVGGFNTSSFAPDDILYLSNTGSGTLTNVRPVANIVPVARVLNSSVSGKIFVDVKPTADNLTLDPTGFIDPTAVTVSYDQATRQVTLTGNFKAVWKNFTVKELTNGWVSPAHSATLGKYYLYYDGASFIWSTTSWTFDKLMICTVDYDGVNNIAFNEVHGVMPWTVHSELHKTIGTFLTSGGDLSGYTLASTTAANRRPLIASTVITDEDLPTSLPALSSASYTQFYLSGASTGNYAFAQSEIVPVNVARPFYNQFTGGNWVQTPMTNNAYQALWLVALPVESSAQSQKYRYLWIQGQSESTTLATIQALTPADVNLNGLNTSAAELVFIGKVIIRYVGIPTNNWQITSVQKLTGSRYNQTAVAGSQFLSSVTTDGSFTGAGTPSAPLALSATVTLTGYIYYGDAATDGTIRKYQSGGALITEKRISGTYVEIYREDEL